MSSIARSTDDGGVGTGCRFNSLNLAFYTCDQSVETTWYEINWVLHALCIPKEYIINP